MFCKYCVCGVFVFTINKKLIQWKTITMSNVEHTTDYFYDYIYWDLCLRSFQQFKTRQPKPTKEVINSLRLLKVSCDTWYQDVKWSQSNNAFWYYNRHRLFSGNVQIHMICMMEH